MLKQCRVYKPKLISKAHSSDIFILINFLIHVKYFHEDTLKVGVLSKMLLAKDLFVLNLAIG